jgi:methylthioribose-1-phosphate isomerase
VESPTTVPTVIAKGVLLEKDAVRILDRRIFPLRTDFLTCRTYEEVAVAIEQMVTQSSGPFFAASAGFVLAAREAQKLASPKKRQALIAAAAARLVHTRPTNNNIRDVIGLLTREASAIIDEPDLAERLERVARQAWVKHFDSTRALGTNAAKLINDGDVLLTHCWGESYIIDTLNAALRASKGVKVICTETRPYLQGARLAAHSIAELGIEVTVITDGMAAHAMDRGMVSSVVTATDRVTLSGHVINKVGTHQLAIVAKNFQIPFYALVQLPDAEASTPADVVMEERDGEETLHCLGMRTATTLAKGWYPSFDVTPPHLVSAIATSAGIFNSYEIREKFGGSRQ